MNTVDPQPLQILDHRLRLLDERIKKNRAKQYDLIVEEGQFVADRKRIENEKYSLLKAG